MATTTKAIVRSVTKKAPAKAGVAPLPVAVRRSREDIMTDVCAQLEAGGSLNAACAKVPDAKLQTILDWSNKYPELGGQYTRARETGYALLADEIVAISDEKEVEVRYDEENVILKLDATGVARNRLRVDTRKWMLSKMLPKIYGDKITTEVTGAGGGPVQIAAMNLKNLSDVELNQMQELLNRSGETE